MPPPPFPAHRTVLTPNRSKGQWSDEEDEIIREFVKQRLLTTGDTKFSNWTDLSSHLMSMGYDRLGKQGKQTLGVRR